MAKVLLLQVSTFKHTKLFTGIEILGDKNKFIPLWYWPKFPKIAKK
jgi:hypothetical protein